MSEVNQAVRDDTDELMNIIKLRTAIGLLGEKDQGNWWPSLWLTSNAVAFLSPIYGERTDAARYQGLVETARLVHDSRIGVGRAFHLFRLPEILERRLHDAVMRDNAMSTAGVVQKKDDAEALLSGISDPIECGPGPIRVGSAEDFGMPAWTKVVAGHYLTAFRNSQQTFPYFAESL
ncbi:BrxE family protein [Tateyamaria sp.]|uniref:BrxE family protein n=1 Tax=Tateyamaria sp. TaxID=1929288 RepID=UPI00329F97C9